MYEAYIHMYVGMYASYLLLIALMTLQNVTQLRSASMRNPGLIFSGEKRLLSSLKHVEWLWSPPCL